MLPKDSQSLPDSPSQTILCYICGPERWLGNLIGDWGAGGGGVYGFPRVGSHTCSCWFSGTLKSDGFVNE